MNRKPQCRWLPWLVLAVAYLCTVGFYAKYGMHNLNSDISSEMVLAELLNEERGFLSENWYYSTELRVVSPVPVYQLGLLLFDSWHTAHTFAIAVLLAGAVLSLIYLLRGAGVGDAGMYAAAALIVPFSDKYDFLFVYGGFYTVYFMLTCWLVGLTLRLPQRKGRIVRLLFIAVLSFWGGLSGVRMLMMCGAPLMLVCAVLAFMRLAQSDTLRQAASSQEASAVTGAVISLLAMVGGYCVNAFVFAGKYNYVGYQDTLFQSIDLSAIRLQLEYIIELFGARVGVSLLSLQGLANMAALCLVLLILICLAWYWVSRRELAFSQKVLVGFAVAANGLGICLNMVTGLGDANAYSVAYYLPGLLLLVVLVFLWVEKMPFRMSWVRTSSFLLLTAVFGFEAMMTLRATHRKTSGTIEEAAQWLVENGYTNGYATFWNSNVMTEASDGVLDVYVYYSWEGTELYPWLQRTTHLDTPPEGPVFVYISEDDYHPTQPPCEQEDHLAWRSKEGSIYIYDSAAEVDALQRAQWSEADPPSGE